MPDVLVMTATPIPRTAAMTVYGDLDTTVLDELPPGRTPITTQWARGPLEEAGGLGPGASRGGGRSPGLRGLPAGRGVRARPGPLGGRGAGPSGDGGAGRACGSGSCTGSCRPRTRRPSWTTFRAGEIDVLVATTVIEVGVDVPNATVMVIEDAERFGIAQLHQLRGRVGRRRPPSWCYLLGGGSERRRRRAAGGPGAQHRRLRAGRGRPRAAGRGHHPRHPAEGRHGPQAGVPAAGQGPGRRRPARWRSTWWTRDPALAGLPELADEIRLLVDDEDREFLFKS